MIWHKLLPRNDVDITTVSEIDAIFYKLLWNFTKTKEELFFTYFSERQMTHYVNADEHALGKVLYNKYFNTPQKIERHYKTGKHLLKTIRSSTQTWEKRIAKEHNPQLFHTAWKEFHSQFRTINHIYSITSWVAIEFWQKEAEQLLSHLFERNNITTNQDFILKTIYTPWKKTALMEIQDKLQQGVPPSKIIQDYQFLRSWAVVWYTLLEEAWLSSFMKPLADPFPHLSQEKALTLLNPSKEERKLLEMAQYIIFFKDWRDDVRRSAAYHWSFLSDAIATYWNIPRDDVGYLTFEEIESALKNKTIPLEQINMRKTHPCIITSTEQKLHIIVNDFPLPEKYPAIIVPLEINSSTLIKGFIAYPGKVQGRVRLIHSYHDIKKIQQGEILVANTTHPTYVPGMHKAAAIVTNEGGIASHAAVVARELLKPCIVGTKTATKVLQDGDLVEVDATTGIVQKITTFK